MADPLAQAWAWIDANPTEWRPTEILLPVKLAVAPTWLHQERRGAWLARLDVGVSFDELLEAGVIGEPLGSIIECEHDHPSPDEAWACADDLGRRVAQHVLDARWDL